MEIKDRLQMVMKMNNLTASAFADKIKVQRSSVSHILAGRNKPSLDFIQKLLNEFPRVNADWLISGKNNNSNTAKPSVGNRVEVGPKESLSNSKTEKRIKKIIVFYSDGTFEETIKDKES